MKYSDLARRVLFAPMQLGADRLCILSGYATPNMASWLIKNLKKFKSRPIDLSLIVGMVPFDGLSISVHEGFKELQKELLPYEVVHYQCSYVYGSTPVHAKVYIWLKGDEPCLLYTSTGDYDVTVQSIITGHSWYVHKPEIPGEDACINFHRHRASHPYHQHG